MQVVNYLWGGDKQLKLSEHPKIDLAMQISQGAVALLNIALLGVILAGIGGGFPTSAFKWVVIGLSGSMVASHLLRGQHRYTKLVSLILLVTACTLITLAVLQHCHILNLQKAAFGMFCTIIGGSHLAHISRPEAKKF